MRDRKHIEQAITDVLKPLGFKRKTSTWRRELDDLFWVFNLQKSQWSDLYYINIGIFVKELEAISAPFEYQCQLRERLESLMRGEKDKIGADRLKWALNMENEMEEADRARLLTEALDLYVVPFYADFKSVKDLVNTISQKKRAYLLPWKDLLDFVDAHTNA